MKKIIISVLSLALLIVLWSQQATIVKAVGFFIRSGANISTLRTSSSTTTPNYLRPGIGTTTLTFDSSDLESVTVEMLVYAFPSNTQGYLNIERQASDDGIDWFTYDDTIKNPTNYLGATTTIPLASTTVPLTYKPATIGATTTKSFSISLQRANQTRLIFTAATTTAIGTGITDALSLWANIIGGVRTSR